MPRPPLSGCSTHHQAAILTATVIISMALTPLGVFALRWLLPPEKPSMDGIEVADDLHGSALLIGFGRFGQVASQACWRAGSTCRSSTSTPR